MFLYTSQDPGDAVGLVEHLLSSDAEISLEAARYDLS